MTRSTYATIVICASIMLAGGCVSQQKADDIQSLYRKSQEQVEDLRAQLEEAEARIDAFQEMGRQPDPRMLRELEQALAERDRALAALDDAQTALRRLGRTSGGPLLDPEVDAALVALTQSHPELMAYDPDIGMVRFASDLTFGSGSVELKEAARMSLVELARILNTTPAAGYEVRVVGHTDNVPISKPATRAKHPTNWHLSAHRAISVMELLTSQGVPPQKVLVAGAGEFRPIVANTKRGAEPNRRVEIYLSPISMTDPDAGAESGAMGEPSGSPEPAMLPTPARTPAVTPARTPAATPAATGSPVAQPPAAREPDLSK